MNELTEKQRHWQTHLEAAERFEGGLADYARMHDLDVKKLYVFKGVLRKKAVSGLEQPTGFVRVTTQADAPASNERVEVVLVNNVKLLLADAPGLLERLSKL